MLKTYEYLFYCIFHFLSYAKKKGDREDDTVWVFSIFFSVVATVAYIHLFGFLADQGIFVIENKGLVSILFIIILGFGTMYLNDKYFVSKGRYLEILKEYGEKPRKKDLWIGFFSFLVTFTLMPIWAVSMAVIMDMNH